MKTRWINFSVIHNFTVVCNVKITHFCFMAQKQSFPKVVSLSPLFLQHFCGNTSSASEDSYLLAQLYLQICFAPGFMHAHPLHFISLFVRHLPPSSVILPNFNTQQDKRRHGGYFFKRIFVQKIQELVCATMASKVA